MLLILGLGWSAATTPMPWGGLWLLAPAGVMVSLLASWRFGAWGVLVPVALMGVSMGLAGPQSPWVWWIPVTALSGVWMGLREEGGGPAAGDRAWMLLPVLLLAAGLPWTLRYPELVARVERSLSGFETGLVDFERRAGYPADRLSDLERALETLTKVQHQGLPSVLPSMLFVWNALLVGAGRSLASQVTALFRWPPLSRAPLSGWRLPDGALLVLLASLALLLGPWNAWAPTAWTLLLNAGLGYCVQGIAVVESLLLARGVPPSVIALTMVFVFTVAWPVFMLATGAVGLSDVWLDYRRLERVPGGDPS